MAGIPLYLCPKKLVEAFGQLVASAGCQVELLQSGHCAQVHCGSATVSVIIEPQVSSLANGDMHEVTLIFAAPLIGGKNRKLAKKIHFLLLGSGAKSYGKFFECEMVYQAADEAQNFVKAFGISNMQYRAIDTQPPVRSGILRKGKAKICLLDGPAIDPETGAATRFFALTRCLSVFSVRQQSDLICEVDARFIHAGARRLNFPLSN